MPVEYFDTTNPMNTGIQLFLPVDQYNEVNSTDSNEVLRTNAEAATVYQVALPLIFGIIIIIGIVGNIMVIYVISFRRKLRTVINFLLLNLAVADILFLSFCGPLAIVHFVMQMWTLGDTVCRIVQYFLYVTCTVTIYTLVAVAAVRYMLVVKGGSPACVTNAKNIVHVILGIWAACLLINIHVPLTYGISQNQNGVTECVISCRVTGQLFFSFFFGFAYAIPLMVIATLYFLLVRHLLAEQRGSMIRKGPNTGNDKSRGKHKSSHVTRVLILVVAVFAICWFPLNVHLLWGTFGRLPASFTYRMCLIVWYALIFLNSALNPIIYNFASGEFREAFRGICDSRLRKEGSISSGSGSRGALLKSQTVQTQTK